MPKAQKENAYAGTSLVTLSSVVDGSYVGELVRASGAITLDLDKTGFAPLEWVDLFNVGKDDVLVRAALEDGVNRAEVASFVLYPDQLSRVTFVGPSPPCWCADFQSGLRAASNSWFVVDDAGQSLEARADVHSIGLDLVVEGDSLAGHWRAPWPGVLTAVNAAARAGTASILVSKTRAGTSTPVMGFSAPVGLQVGVDAVLSGEPFAVGDRFQVAVSGYDGLEPDADGIRGVLVSLDVTRVAQ